MKKILVFAGFIFLAGCMSSPPTPTQQETKFEKIFSFPGASKENLYDKSLQWMGRFVEIILYQGPVEGKIICNIERVSSSRNSDTGFYTIYTEIDVKESRARITLTFPSISKEEIEKNREEIFKDYESYMNAKKAADW